jgi:copper chaperone NosL
MERLKTEDLGLRTEMAEITMHPDAGRRSPQSSVLSPQSVVFMGLLASIVALACAGGVPGPAALDTKTETCRSCRMPFSDASLASQLVAPGEEPKFFDDIVCLRDFLAGSPSTDRRSLAFVADHRTRAWVPASAAVFTRSKLETPMGSHWIAHADAASRDADPAAAGGANVPAREIFGTAGPPDAR